MIRKTEHRKHRNHSVSLEPKQNLSLMQHWSLEMHGCETKLLCSWVNIVPILVTPVEIGKKVFIVFFFHRITMHSSFFRGDRNWGIFSKFHFITKDNLLYKYTQTSGLFRICWKKPFEKVFQLQETEPVLYGSGVKKIFFPRKYKNQNQNTEWKSSNTKVFIFLKNG